MSSPLVMTSALVARVSDEVETEPPPYSTTCRSLSRMSAFSTSSSTSFPSSGGGMHLRHPKSSSLSQKPCLLDSSMYSGVTIQRPDTNPHSAFTERGWSGTMMCVTLRGVVACQTCTLQCTLSVEGFSIACVRATRRSSLMLLVAKRRSASSPRIGCRGAGDDLLLFVPLLLDDDALTVEAVANGATTRGTAGVRGERRHPSKAIERCGLRWKQELWKTSHAVALAALRTGFPPPPCSGGTGGGEAAIARCAPRRDPEREEAREPEADGSTRVGATARSVFDGVPVPIGAIPYVAGSEVLSALSSSCRLCSLL